MSEIKRKDIVYYLTDMAYQFSIMAQHADIAELESAFKMASAIGKYIIENEFAEKEAQVEKQEQI